MNPNEKTGVPQSRKPAQPQQTRPAQAQQTRSAQPQQTRPAQPQQTRPAQPQQTRPAQAQQTRPAQPQQTRPAQPQQQRKPAPQQTQKPVENKKQEKPQVQKLKISREAIDTINGFSEIFCKYNMKPVAKKLVNTYKNAMKDRFTVAVVGEFSTGKSTFINRMLGRELLPVSNLPSTALMTRIRYNEKESLVVTDEKGRKVKTLPLETASWRGLTAENFDGQDAKGTLYAGVNDEWLKYSNVEVIDTPGAGDLEQERVRVIGDALRGCDGAIITTRATGALSMSEKLFIEQRLISKRTPFMMLVVTKLDQIPLRERIKMLDYITRKLDSWGMNIPVYVPYQVELTSDKYDHIVGMDKIKKQIEKWVSNPERAELTEEWIMSNVFDTVQAEVNALEEQLMLQREADESKRQELIDKKKQLLKDAKVEWENLRINFLERANDCTRLISEKGSEFKLSVVEKLQYEVSHNNDLKKWWTNDYPYRLKIEITNMSTAIENTVMRRIADDARWFNTALEKNFKTHVVYNDKMRIMDKYLFNQADIGQMKLFDVSRNRTLTRIGTTAVTLALAIGLGAAGAAAAAAGMATAHLLATPLVATMGFGTGSSIVTEKVFGAKIEQQRTIVKDAIAANVPQIIDRAMSQSDTRVRYIYANIIRSALEKEKEWTEKQREAIEKSIKPLSDDGLKRANDLKNELRDALSRL